MTTVSIEFVVMGCVVMTSMSVKFIVMGYVVMVTSSESMFGGVERICVMSGRNAMTIMSDKVLVGMMRGCNAVTIMSVQVGVVAWSVVERLVFSMGR